MALLGSLLAQGDADRVTVTGLPPAVAEVARDSVVGGLAVAGRLGDDALAASAKAAYLHGMTLVPISCRGYRSTWRRARSGVPDRPSSLPHPTEPVPRAGGTIG